MIKHRFDFLPLFITLTAAVLSLFYFTLFGDRNIIIYLQVGFCALIPLFLIVAEKLCKFTLSPISHITLAVQIVLSSALGSGAMLYATTTWWDNLTHLLFGFTASVLFADLFKGANFLLHSLSVMGCAAIWEIFEFVCDNLLGGDAQRVLYALQNGLNPIADTMTDICITIVGIGAFVVISKIKIKTAE